MNDTDDTDTDFDEEPTQPHPLATGTAVPEFISEQPTRPIPPETLAETRARHVAERDLAEQSKPQSTAEALDVLRRSGAL